MAIPFNNRQFHGSDRRQGPVTSAGELLGHMSQNPYEKATKPTKTWSKSSSTPHDSGYDHWRRNDGDDGLAGALVRR